MDRQTLIEEKRQRLQQLRQRRYDTSGNLVEQLLQKHLPVAVEKKLVDVAVQVDFVHGEETDRYEKPAVVKEETQCTTFDKAIQAVPLEPEVKPPPKNEVKKSSKALNLNKVIEVRDVQQVSKFDEYVKNYQKVVQNRSYSKSFETIQRIHEVDRKVNQIVFCHHYPDLVMVTYSNTQGFSKLASPGLSIIYSISTKMPQFYLTCSSPITSILFDKIDHHKVIAGMSDGRICIWNLREATNSDLELLPVLISPMISSVITSPFDVEQHVLPIVSLFQNTADGSNSIISISLDGVINVWSTNLLALPKQDSIRLVDPNATRFREHIRISQAIEITSDDVYLPNAHDEPNSFLNQFVIVSEAGNIVKLCNDKSKKYMEVAEKDSLSTGVIAFKLLSEKYIITSNFDWNLRLWDINSANYIVDIPTTSLIFLIAIRPKYSLQFVTVGVNNSTSQSVVEYWDLNKKLLAPICSIQIEGDHLAASIVFDPSGETMIIGFENGSIVQIGIDANLLNAQVNEQQENGIQSYLSTL